MTQPLDLQLRLCPRLIKRGNIFRYLQLYLPLTEDKAPRLDIFMFVRCANRGSFESLTVYDKASESTWLFIDARGLPETMPGRLLLRVFDMG